MLGEIGLPTSYRETIREFVGLSMASCIEIIERRLGRPVPVDFTETYEQRLLTAFRRQLRPVPGVHEALDRIHYPTCVASSGTHEKMRGSLSLTGLLPRFERRLFSATEVDRGKPHPDLFLHAARCSGVRPADCAVVEDTVRGVQAGVAAGMTVFGYARICSLDELSAVGARAFDDMGRLPGLLEANET
jgi:HAD superfamily hydrolase (TIGR01509 family)